MKQDRRGGGVTIFEAVITVCLALSEPAICRDQLLPGYEAARLHDCTAALAARPPSVAGVRCKAAGPTLEVHEVAPGVFVHMGEIAEPDMQNRGDVTNLGFVIGSDAVAVIDSGTARWMGEGLWRAIRARSDKPVRYIVLTHMHPDHVLGAGVFAEAGAQVAGHAHLRRALADRRANYLQSLERLIGPEAFLGTDTPQVDIEVAAVLELDLGDRPLQVQAWPTAHTGNDVTVLDRTTGTLFAGDLVFDRHAPALDGSLVGWRRVLDTLAGMEVSRLIPGHGGPVLGWPEGAAAMQRYLEVLERDTRAAIAAGARLGEAVEVIAASQAHVWELFDAYNPRNATVAFTELEWD
ncbi:MAG: quinoprotein relay system zinc metallohydrolase 2 [Sulfitobacter sp.]